MQHVHVFYGIIGFNLLLVSFFFFIIWSLGKLQQYKKEAFKQVSLLAEVTAQEKEKNRMTLQLHEDFGPLLSTIKMYMGNFTLTEDREIEQRQTAREIVDDLLVKIRTIAREYLPYSLQQRNLKDALHDYIGYINEHHNHLIHLSMSDRLPSLSTNKNVHIYRIVQEIIDNTIEHAHATQLTIQVKQEDDLILITQDNGMGFDYEQELEKAKGIGLNNLITRTQLLKGTLKVHAVKDKGTMYAIRIPL